MKLSQLTINQTRLLQYIAAMADIGMTPKGGCNRQALTEEDQRGRQLFLDWCHHLGGKERRDTMGNLFVRWSGSDNCPPPVLMSSHLDTQPTGGHFDGVYGVLAALEVVATLHDAGITTRHPLEIAVWTNEEGARFAPAMMGSGVFSGALEQADIYQSADKSGVTVYDALVSSLQLGETPCQPFPIFAALELHIEQGPILESKGLQIGVVTGVQGMNWFDVTITGETTHAGPTPMAMRRDPVQLCATLLNEIYALADRYGEHARLTIGDIKVQPGARNTVPSQVIFSVDLRHPEQIQLEAMTADFHAICSQLNGAVSIAVSPIWHSPAVRFHARCIDAIEKASQQLNYRAINMVSGAGHDSVYLSRIAPVGMIFIPCRNGVSHNEAEYASPEQLTTGANVLLHALLNLTDASTY